MRGNSKSDDRGTVVPEPSSLDRAVGSDGGASLSRFRPGLLPPCRVDPRLGDRQVLLGRLDVRLDRVDLPVDRRDVGSRDELPRRPFPRPPTSGHDPPDRHWVDSLPFCDHTNPRKSLGSLG